MEPSLRNTVHVLYSQVCWRDAVERLDVWPWPCCRPLSNIWSISTPNCWNKTTFHATGKADTWSTVSHAALMSKRPNRVTRVSLQCGIEYLHQRRLGWMMSAMRRLQLRHPRPTSFRLCVTSSIKLLIVQ